MNFFIATSVGFFLIAILSGLFAVIFKILIFGDFKMDEKWFNYSLTFQQLKFDSENKKETKLISLSKWAYFFFSNFSNISLVLGTLFMAANFFKVKS